MSSSVGAGFDHGAAIENDDPVGKVQRRLAVRDQQGGATGMTPRSASCTSASMRAFDRAGGIVEDGGFAGRREYAPRERDPLALSAREAQPTLADRRVVSLVASSRMKSCA